MSENWTDEQDALAYEMFAKFADEDTVSSAVFHMRVILRMGADFTEDNIAAWRKKYEAEEWSEYQAGQERSADQFIYRSTTV